MRNAYLTVGSKMLLLYFFREQCLESSNFTQILDKVAMSIFSKQISFTYVFLFITSKSPFLQAIQLCLFLLMNLPLSFHKTLFASSSTFTMLSFYCTFNEILSIEPFLLSTFYSLLSAQILHFFDIIQSHEQHFSTYLSKHIKDAYYLYLAPLLSFSRVISFQSFEEHLLLVVSASPALLYAAMREGLHSQ